MATILICSPSDDSPKRITQHYLRQYADYAAECGHKVYFMREPLLDTFESAILKYNPEFVLLNGHGGSKGVTGLDFHVILGVKSYDNELRLKIQEENAELMVGRMVYMISCFSMKELGHQLFQRGAQGVAGYQDAFVFLSENNENDLSFNEDYVAGRFLECALVLPRRLAEGAAFGEGCTATRNAWRNGREQAMKLGAEDEAKYMHWNLINFVNYNGSGVKLLK